MMIALYHQVKTPVGFDIGGIQTQVPYTTIRDFTS
jgi:hypothetical protein